MLQVLASQFATLPACMSDHDYGYTDFAALHLAAANGTLSIEITSAPSALLLCLRFALMLSALHLAAAASPLFSRSSSPAPCPPRTLHPPPTRPRHSAGAPLHVMNALVRVGGSFSAKVPEAIKALKPSQQLQLTAAHGSSRQLTAHLCCKHQRMLQPPQ